MIELGSESAGRVVQARAHGPGWHTQTLGDRIGGEVGPVAEDDGSAMLRAEPAKGATDDVLVDRSLERVYGRDAGSVGQGRLGTARAAAKALGAGVREDAIEPRVEPGGVAQTGPGGPRGEERLLTGVLGIGGVAKEVPRKAVGAIEPRPDEDRERLVAPGPLDRLVGRPRHSHLGSRHGANHITPDGLAPPFVHLGTGPPLGQPTDTRVDLQPTPGSAALR